MIPIRRSNLQELAEQHYESIIIYANKKNAKIFTVEDIWRIECWLKDTFKITFRELILAKPEELDRLASLFNELKYDIKKIGSETSFKLHNIDVIQVLKITDLYKAFSPKNSNMKSADGNPYNGNILVQSLGLTVCPYCNRNFINTIYKFAEDNSDKSKTIDRRTSQLDHFYPKSIFPVLALSFYNLIPSCMFCNFIKKDISVVNKFYNPYDTRYDGNKAFRFKLKISSPEFYYKKEAIEICYDDLEDSTEAKKRVKENLDVFEIEGLYKNHKDFVLEIIQKNIIYNDSYIDELYRKYEGTLFKNREDVLRLLTSNYISDEDLEKRPLAKLTRDIAEDLKLL